MALIQKIKTLKECKLCKYWKGYSRLSVRLIRCNRLKDGIASVLISPSNEYLKEIKNGTLIVRCWEEENGKL